MSEGVSVVFSTGFIAPLLESDFSTLDSSDFSTFQEVLLGALAPVGAAQLHAGRAGRGVLQQQCGVPGTKVEVDSGFETWQGWLVAWPQDRAWHCKICIKVGHLKWLAAASAKICKQNL